MKHRITKSKKKTEHQSDNQFNSNAVNTAFCSSDMLNLFSETNKGGVTVLRKLAKGDKIWDYKNLQNITQS